VAKPDKIYLEKGFGMRNYPEKIGHLLHCASGRELLQQSDIATASYALVSC
jgi:hypothetical protein